MKISRMRMFGLMAILTLSVYVTGCSSDDDPAAPGGGGDTTAPKVQAVVPAAGTLMVDLDLQMTITFDEAMDTATATGQVALSHGTISGLDWTDDMTLVVTHTSWPEATRVTATLGTGIKDKAGNALASAVEIGYGTRSDDLFVFGTTPAGGAADINRSASVILDFGAIVAKSQVEAGVVISDGTKAVHPFLAVSSNESTWILDPDELLPADTEITVTVGTGVTSQQGTNFPAPFEFSFTTNSEVDGTPPDIVSIDPPDGSVMPAGQTAITITFSEPINPDNFRPTSMAAQLQWLLNNAPAEPEFNPAGDAITVPLPTDLPAGLPLAAVFADYEDLAGNVQTAETSWSVTVAGTADPFPVEDGMRFLMIGEWAEGEAGSEEPTNWGDDWIFYQFTERGTAGHWNKESWYDEQYTVLEDYDILSVSGSGIRLIGFAEQDENKAFTEIMLTSPAVWAELPFQAGNTWSQTTSAVLPDGTVDVELSGEVIGQGDLLMGEFDGITVSWHDVWHVRIDLDLSNGGELFAQEVDEVWYAPGVGIVRERNREDNVEPGNERWSTEDRWLSIGIEQ